MTDDPTECVFGALVIARQWCEARWAVSQAREENRPGSMTVNPGAKDRAVEEIEKLEKTIADYSEPGHSYGYHCSDAISGRFTPKSHELLRAAKDDVRKGDYMAAQDALSEAL
jgi:hypothetical protein